MVDPGAEGEGAMTSPRTVTMDEKTRRLSICATCDDWCNKRCKQIDLGCRTTFLAVLRSESGKCPRSKWSATPVHRCWFWPSVQRLNLLYHVCPITSNDVWRSNVSQVKRRLRIFTGRKVVAVVQGDRLHSLDVVQRELNDHSIEYITRPNDPELREVATFLDLLQCVESTDSDEATFYGHTKGNSTADNALGAEMWRNAMYHHLLDGVHTCRDLLGSHPCVGTHKMRWERREEWSPFPSGLNVGNWMYAGTFFWFRNDAVYGHPKWRDVPRDRYGAEAWLSMLFDVEPAATVFQPWPVNEYPVVSPYDPAIYLWPIRDT